MLLCLKCNEEKPFEVFSKKNGRVRGYQSYCKPCLKEVGKQWRKSNPEKVKAANKRTYFNNREKRIKLSMDCWNKLSPEVRTTKTREYRLKNLSRVRFLDSLHTAERRTRVPKWLTLEQKAQIKSFYDLRDEVMMLTGDEYHVDHILPLRGKTVCGLHVPWNLQVLPADLNMQKSNKETGSKKNVKEPS